MEMTLLEDRELVEQAREGDGAAFRALIERYKKKIYAVALDMTGDHHNAEDISQDVFLKAFRSLPGFRGRASVSTWLYRMTVNACIDRSRKKAWKAINPKGALTDDDIYPQAQGRNTLSDPEKELEKALLQRHIRRALDSLTQRERAVFVLRHYHAMPLKEIADCLNVTVGTVKSTLFRALKRLQEKLAPYVQGDMI
jgi:RNA polymerase sigma-70 factor (ECF subfamily)